MLAKQYGDKFTLTNDPDEAARDADVLFTDVWVSMGMEREAEQRRRDFTGFTLDAARMALAKPDCMVQHPLPAHRGEEIAPDVLEAHADEIFDEAENRIYVEKAVLAVLLAVCIGSFGFDTFTEKSSTSLQAAWGRRSRSRCSRPPAISATTAMKSPTTSAPPLRRSSTTTPLPKATCRSCPTASSSTTKIPARVPGPLYAGLGQNAAQAPGLLF